MVGRKEACRSETVAHLLEVGGARQDVVARIKRIETETVASAELTQIPGMSCINPIAPRRDVANAPPPLSTASRHGSSLAKRQSDRMLRR